MSQENYIYQKGRRGRFVNPDNPPPPTKTIHPSIRVSLLAKLDELVACLNPPMSRQYFMREYFFRQFEDWLEKWLEFHKPAEGERVSVERINIFPAVLVDRKRRIWRKK